MPGSNAIVALATVAVLALAACTGGASGPPVTPGSTRPASGTIVEYPVPTANAGPFAITQGPDGNMWFDTFSGDNVVKMITGTGVATPFVYSPTIQTSCAESPKAPTATCGPAPRTAI